jgi:poly(3-hydroxyalkanoate) synthetase
MNHELRNLSTNQAPKDNYKTQVLEWILDTREMSQKQIEQVVEDLVCSNLLQKLNIPGNLALRLQ